MTGRKVRQAMRGADDGALKQDTPHSLERWKVPTVLDDKAAPFADLHDGPPVLIIWSGFAQSNSPFLFDVSAGQVSALDLGSLGPLRKERPRRFNFPFWYVPFGTSLDSPAHTALNLPTYFSRREGIWLDKFGNMRCARNAKSSRT